jgi:hypothetical protein
MESHEWSISNQKFLHCGNKAFWKFFGHDFSLNSERITKNLGKKTLPKIQNHKIEKKKPLEHTINI